MQKTIAKGLFYGVATILILWTGSLTYAFVATALPQAHWLVPLFALVVFDVGMLGYFAYPPIFPILTYSHVFEHFLLIQRVPKCLRPSESPIGT